METRKGFLVLVFAIAVIFISCEKEEENGENETMSSRFNQTESHREGQNCMGCHKSGGSGEGRFSVAGTVFNAAKTAVYPNATIKLYSGINGTGTLIQTIEADAKGNFYTTASVNFGSGLYATVTNSSGVVSKMNSPVTNGQCNSCHGSSTGKISVN